MSLDVENIAECEITDRKPGRYVFRIYYKKTDDFKHYEFETTPQRAGKYHFLFFIFKTVLFANQNMR